MQNNIIVALTTYYPSLSNSDLCRMKLAEKTINLLAKHEFKTIILDGGSHQNFLKILQKYPIEYYQQKTKSIGQGKREVIQKTLDKQAEIIILMEPEKVDFVKNIKYLASFIEENKADIVIPKRKSLKSYPLIQQHTETICNIYYKKLFNLDVDICFGPVLFKRDVAKYYVNYNGKYGDTWDELHIPVLDAYKNKQRVKSVQIEYTHPKEQREQEEHDVNFYKKRIHDQLIPLAEAYEEYWKNSN